MQKILCLVCLISVIFSVIGDVIVNLPCGNIRGLTKRSAKNRTFYAFLQVPYAEPPLGALRFKSPQPVKSWDGVLNATTETKVCYQVFGDLPAENEDCLYLNVFTPVRPGNKQSLPVMFYIHGGGFNNGYSTYDTTGPHHFMDNNVVVVTILYRLGPFGFLSTDDTVLPGNYGLKDQAFALEWVQRNIGNFGGDPKKVTIFGQSSGAVSVGYQLISEKSKNLFRGAIQQSGSVLAPHGYQRRAKSYAYQLAQFIDQNFNAKNTSQELLNLLQNTPAKDIDAATQKFSQGPGNLILNEGSWFAPVIECHHEDAFITDYMYGSLENGKINKVPVMMGITSEEVLSQAADLDAFKVEVSQIDSNVSFLVQADMHIVDASTKTLAGNAIRKIYTDGLLQDNLGAAVKLFSDAYVSKSSLKEAELLSKYTDVYFYQFSYHGALGNNNVYVEGAGRVTHSEDMSYLWVSDDTFNIGAIDAKDLRTVERYVKLFTDFSKTLNPTPIVTDAVNITWPKFTSNSSKYLDIGENLSIKTDLKGEAYRGWVSVYDRWTSKPYDTY